MPGIPASNSVSRDLSAFPVTPSGVQEVSQPQKEEPRRGCDRDLFTTRKQASPTPPQLEGKLELKFRATERQGRSLEKTGEGCGEGHSSGEDSHLGKGCYFTKGCALPGDTPECSEHGICPLR